MENLFIKQQVSIIHYKSTYNDKTSAFTNFTPLVFVRIVVCNLHTCAPHLLQQLHFVDSVESEYFKFVFQHESSEGTAYDRGQQKVREHFDRHMFRAVCLSVSVCLSVECYMLYLLSGVQWMSHGNRICEKDHSAQIYQF